MKLTNIIKESKTIQLEDDPCWKNYQQIGMKMKDGKEVPNCVPKNEVTENVSPRIARGKETGDLIVKLDGKEYTVGFSADGYKSPYRIWPANNDSGFDVNKNPTGKKLWAKMKPMVDKYLQSMKEATHTSQPGEWVGYIETPKGDKLMGRFKTARAAKMWLTKNNNKLLNTDGISRVGIMGIDNWNKFHAKWAVENVNEMNVNKKFGSKYDIGAGSMGNGTTFWNRSQEVRGDYKTIAHVSDSGKVTFYDKKLPNDVKKHIEDYAKTKTEGMVENFIPSVGTIDKFKLKDLLLKNPKVKDILSDAEYKFLKSNNTDVIMHQSKRFNSITTDGKLEFEIDLKNNKLVKPLGKARKAIIDYYSKTKTESVNENCGCGGVKKSNPYSLSEFVIKENDYKIGDVEYTAKNMGPVDIMRLAFQYHQTPITKLAGKNIDHRIRVARDLGRLIGKNHINPNERGKEPAWLLYPYKGKLVSTEEYKEIYNGLFDKLKRLVKYIKNADPATRRDAAAAKAAARADIKKEF
jgi:hypothetical protein